MLCVRTDGFRKHKTPQTGWSFHPVCTAPGISGPSSLFPMKPAEAESTQPQPFKLNKAAGLDAALKMGLYESFWVWGTTRPLQVVLRLSFHL